VSAIAAPADRRFRRAHIKPSRKRRKWQAVVVPAARFVLIMLVSGYAAYRGSVAVAHARVLQVDRVVVRGNQRLSTGDVLAALAGLRGENLIWTDLNRWHTRLLATPWVRDAVLRRSFPSTIEVLVWERSPIGVARLGQEMYLVDERGLLIDRYGPQYADLDLPIVDGLAASPQPLGTATDEGRADLAARVLTALRPKPAVARRVSQIDVSDARDATVILDGDSATVHLGTEQFLARLESYLGLAATLRERVPDIDSVDLRFDDRIYVRPAAKSKTADRAARTR